MTTSFAAIRKLMSAFQWNFDPTSLFPHRLREFCGPSDTCDKQLY